MSRRLLFPLVEVTGGEPLLQEKTPELCAALIGKGFEVLVETNGSLPLDVLPDGVCRIVDCKCPSSGESERMLMANFERLSRLDEVKFVIGDRSDFDYAVELTRRHSMAERAGAILFSPVTDQLSPRALVEWMLAERPPARFQLQLHKIIWDPKARGV